MSTMTSKDSKQLDREYQETVLKVPDGLGVERGAITKEMLATHKETYKVISVNK